MSLFHFLTLSTLTLVWLTFAQPALASSLTLSPTTTNIQVGRQFTYDLRLDPLNHSVVGTDIILNFDPTVITPISVINTGHIVSTATIRLTDNPGQLKFSLANPYGRYTTTSGTIATLTFQALKSGQTSLTFDHTPGSTRDTNVVAPKGTDVLTTTNQVKITVSAIQSTKSATPTPTPTTPATTTTTPHTSQNPILGTTNSSNRRILGDTDSTDTTRSATLSAALALTPTPTPITNLSEALTKEGPTLTGLTTQTDKFKQLLLLATGSLLIAIGTALAVYLYKYHRHTHKPLAFNQ